MTAPLSPLDQAAVVADAERRNGFLVTEVDCVEINTLIETTCAVCGVPIKMLCIRRCDACMETLADDLRARAQ